MTEYLSHIVTKQPTTNEHDGSLQSCLRPRTTEIAALSRVSPSTALGYHEQTLLYWERVGMQPGQHLSERERPQKPLAGAALYGWIAARVSAGNWRDVEDSLGRISSAWGGR